MKNRLVIVGASGHGKVVADIAQLNGYTDIVFLDDNKSVGDKYLLNTINFYRKEINKTQLFLLKI